MLLSLEGEKGDGTLGMEGREEEEEVRNRGTEKGLRPLLGGSKTGPQDNFSTNSAPKVQNAEPSKLLKVQGGGGKFGRRTLQRKPSTCDERLSLHTEDKESETEGHA